MVMTSPSLTDNVADSKLSLASRRSATQPQPQIVGMPYWRAISAAWLVRPPREVRTPTGSEHSAEIVRVGLFANEDDFLAALRHLDSGRGIKRHMSGSAAGTCVQALGDRLRYLFGALDPGVQKLFQSLRSDAHQRFFLGDRAFAHHIDRDLDSGNAGSLAGAALQDEESALFDGELDVLHVAIMLFEFVRDVGELACRSREFVLELIDRLGGAHAGDDVLALGVLQELTEELVLAGGGVARERDARAAVVAHIAEDHRLNVDGGAKVMGDLFAVAVDDRALVVPALEDSDDRELELLQRIGRGSRFR